LVNEALKPWAWLVREAEHEVSQLSVWVAQLRCELQLAVVPPNAPTQVQLKGPDPVMVLAEPAVHRFDDGALSVLPPSAVPQAPFTTASQLVALRLQTPSLQLVVAAPL